MFNDNKKLDLEALDNITPQEDLYKNALSEMETNKTDSTQSDNVEKIVIAFKNFLNDVVIFQNFQNKMKSIDKEISNYNEKKETAFNKIEVLYNDIQNSITKRISSIKKHELEEIGKLSTEITTNETDIDKCMTGINNLNDEIKELEQKQSMNTKKEFILKRDAMTSQSAFLKYAANISSVNSNFFNELSEEDLNEFNATIEELEKNNDIDVKPSKIEARKENNKINFFVINQKKKIASKYFAAAKELASRINANANANPYSNIKDFVNIKNKLEGMESTLFIINEYANKATNEVSNNGNIDYSENVAAMRSDYTYINDVYVAVTKLANNKLTKNDYNELMIKEENKRNDIISFTYTPKKSLAKSTIDNVVGFVKGNPVSVNRDWRSSLYGICSPIKDFGIVNLPEKVETNTLTQELKDESANKSIVSSTSVKKETVKPIEVTDKEKVESFEEPTTEKVEKFESKKSFEDAMFQPVTSTKKEQPKSDHSFEKTLQAIEALSNAGKAKEKTPSSIPVAEEVKVEPKSESSVQDQLFEFSQMKKQLIDAKEKEEKQQEKGGMRR